MKQVDYMCNILFSQGIQYLNPLKGLKVAFKNKKSQKFYEKKKLGLGCSWKIPIWFFLTFSYSNKAKF